MTKKDLVPGATFCYEDKLKDGVMTTYVKLKCQINPEFDWGMWDATVIVAYPDGSVGHYASHYHNEGRLLQHKARSITADQFELIERVAK